MLEFSCSSFSILLSYLEGESDAVEFSDPFELDKK